MPSQPLINLQQSAPTDDKLLVAILIATLIHAALILGINFSPPELQKINKSIEITLVNAPAKKVPDKADFLAQENQIGTGEQKIKPKPAEQKISNQGNSKTSKKIAPVKEEKKTSATNRKVVTQQLAEKKSVSSEKSEIITDQPKKELSPEMLSQQISQLGVSIRRHQASSQSEIKFANSLPSTHKALASEYIRSWTEKVTRTGNMNYPEIARQNHFSGSLNMDVGINHDGSVYSIRINKSSGIKALDDAAKRIVQLGAPYAPLPKQLREELKVLIITRIWQFSDEAGFQ